jgi:dUTP pyrophosphatase
MSSLAIPVINKSGFPLPAYATSGASGMDLRAAIPGAIVLEPMERRLIPTGIFLEIPEGYEGQVRPRSGLALKKGLTCLNSPGTIDADYRGEVGVIIINLSGERQEVEPGERIAQLVFQRVEQATWIASETIGASTRGAGGFGHTGTH